MQTTLRIDDTIYRQAKAEAARRGMTLTHFIEQALEQKIHASDVDQQAVREEIAERNRLMEELLQRTAHFQIGAKPTRDEMNER